MPISELIQEMNTLDQKVKDDEERRQLIANHRAKVREFLKVSNELLLAIEQRLTAVEQGGAVELRDINDLGDDAQVIAQTIGLVSRAAKEFADRTESIARDLASQN